MLPNALSDSARRSRPSFSASSPPDEPDELFARLRAATLGRYDIYAELGRGGMAAVYLALDVALARKVAIKVMLPEITSDVGAIERFRREAQLAAGLSHPHIIPVFSVGDSTNLAYFVMKFVDGRSLDSVLHNEGRQSADFVCAVLQQVGSALDYAHRRGITHRDIKPANIMLDDGGWVVLADFGIAKASDAQGLTSSGVMVGTPAYMSPEHFNRVEVGPPADQYALGCVAYELLTGARPFERKTIGELMKAHLLDEPEALFRVCPSCPATLASVIHRMLAKDPAERFPYIGAAIAALGATEPDLQQRVSMEITQLARVGSASRPRISQPISPTPLNAPQSIARSSHVSDASSSLGAIDTRQVRWPAVGLASAALLLIGGGATVALMRYQQSAGSARTSPPAPTTVPPSPPPRQMSPSPAATAAASPQRAAPTSASRAKVKSVETRVASTLLPRAPVAPSRTSAPSVGDSLSARIGPSSAVTAIEPPRTTDSIQVTKPMTTSLEPARLRIGTHMSDAVLYINGDIRRIAGRGLQWFTLPPGTYRLRITAEECGQPWDSTITLAAADTSRILYRDPKCIAKSVR